MSGKLASPLLWRSDGTAPETRSLAFWREYTGQTREEVAQDWRWLDAIHPDDRKKVRLTIDRAMHTHAIHTLCCRIWHQPDSYQHFKILISPCFDASHDLQSWFIFFIDESTIVPERPEHWESLSMYNTVLQQHGAGVLCLSLDGTILQTNQRMCQMLGYSEEELFSRTLWQLSTPEYIGIQLQAMRKRLLSGDSQQPIRTCYQRKDGSYIWIRLIDFLMSLTSGEPVYFFYLVEDITDQVEAETERAELLARVQEAHAQASAQAQQLEAIFESIADGIMVSDANGHIIRSNAAVKRILHLDRAPGFLQMPPHERSRHLQIFDEKGRKLKPEEWPLARLVHGDSLQEINMANDMYEILPDGEGIYVSHSGAALRDQNNRIIGAAMVLRDVTERHRLEHNVRKSFGILLTLAEELVHIPKLQEPVAPPKDFSSPWASFAATGRYLTAMTCEMLEYELVSLVLLNPENEQILPIAIEGVPEETGVLYQKELEGKPLSYYLDEAIIARLRRNEVVLNAPVFCAPSPGPYEMVVAPMIMDSRLVGVLGVRKKDLSLEYNQEEIGLVKAVAKLILLVMERERLQKEWIESHSSELALREANKRFDEFLSIASHELRTPLAGIKGNVQLARRQLNKIKSGNLSDVDAVMAKLDSIQDYLLHAEHRVNVQNRMISDLLDVSRIQANKLELVMRPCDMIQIVSNAVEDQRYNASGRTLTLMLPPQKSLIVIGDADRLSQVIHNYLTNALKYSPPDLPVEVYLEMDREKHMVYVAVRDNGPGLTPEEQKHVWERFYRVKGIITQGNSGPGLGLGLHICRTIIEAHEGRIGLESAPGSGSTFWFALPMARQASLSAEESSLPQTDFPNERLEQHHSL